MAEAIDLFRKRSKALRALVEEGAADIERYDRFTSHSLPEFRNGMQEFAAHAAELKAGGSAGTAPKDFLGDKTAKSMYARLDQIVAEIGKKSDELYRDVTKPLAAVADLEKLRDEIDSEIKLRKKKTLTKIGLGNKSLPDMEKLLKEVSDYIDKNKLFKSVFNYSKDDKDGYQQELDKDLPALLTKALAGVKIANRENDKALAMLDVRKLAGSRHKAQIYHDEILALGAKGEKDGYDRPLGARMAKTALAFKQLVDPYEEAIKNSSVKAEIKNSKYKDEITKSVDAMLDMRRAVKVELQRVRAAIPPG